MFVGVATLYLHFGANAQVQSGAFGYYKDALRFSQLNQVGTARIAGLSGSGSVLGGDMSSAILNPAGLGFYNRSQFVFTPGFNFNKLSSDFLGRGTNNENSNLDISNLGLVVNFNKRDLATGRWRGG